MARQPKIVMRGVGQHPTLRGKNPQGLLFQHDKAHEKVVKQTQMKRKSLYKWLLSQFIRDDDQNGSTPNNDDDQDWLVDTVPIAPITYLPDTKVLRPKCDGDDWFTNDNTYDAFSFKIDGTRTDEDNVIEKDAAFFADQHD